MFQNCTAGVPGSLDSTLSLDHELDSPCCSICCSASLVDMMSHSAYLSDDLMNGCRSCKTSSSEKGSAREKAEAPTLRTCRCLVRRVQWKGKRFRLTLKDWQNGIAFLSLLSPAASSD